MDHTNGKIRVIEHQIVRNGPHDNKMDVFVTQFPSNGPRGPSNGVQFIDRDNYLAVRGKNFPFMKTILKIAILGIDNRKGEHPFGPIFDGDDAADFMTFAMLLDIFERGTIEVREAVVYENIPVGHQPMDHGGVIVA